MPLLLDVLNLASEDGYSHAVVKNQIIKLDQYVEQAKQQYQKLQVKCQRLFDYSMVVMDAKTKEQLAILQLPSDCVLYANVYQGMIDSLGIFMPMRCVLSRQGTPPEMEQLVKELEATFSTKPGGPYKVFVQRTPGEIIGSKN